MLVTIPYGDDALHLDVPSARSRAILTAEMPTGKEDGRPVVERALHSPIGSKRLSELARGQDRILVIASDHTRPVPTKDILPPMLREIQLGNASAEVKVLIATGFHRAPTKEELRRKFGDLAGELDIQVHDARDEGAMVHKGKLPSGGELWLNKLVDWAHLIVSEGFIEPHFFAGYSGGRKSVLPGVASWRTVFANHCSKFIAHPKARAGFLEGNPIHEDMVFGAKAAPLRFIVNVALDHQKRISAAFAGDPFLAHETGCRYVGDNSSVLRVEGDIVITGNGGYPLDQNVYQAVKCMSTAEACVRPGGVIIAAAACVNGHGSLDFHKWFQGGWAPSDILRRIEAIEQMDTGPDQWQAQVLARVLCRAKVILVCEDAQREIVQNMGLIHARSLDEAFRMASDMTGGGDVVVIPDGVGTIIRQEEKDA